MMAGAAVAGPSMAKEALQVPINGGGAGQLAGVVGGLAKGPIGGWDPKVQARDDLARFLGKTAAQIALEKRSVYVNGIDGDIAAMRSLSWNAKVAMQRERDWEQAQHHQRSHFEAIIAGLFD